MVARDAARAPDSQLALRVRGVTTATTVYEVALEDGVLFEGQAQMNLAYTVHFAEEFGQARGYAAVPARE